MHLINTNQDKIKAIQTLQVYLHAATSCCAANELELREAKKKLENCKKKKKRKKLKKAIKYFKKSIGVWQNQRMIYKAQLRDLERL